VLGYCGPEGGASHLAQRAVGEEVEGFPQLVGAFEGAWPYLELLADTLGLEPLDAAVVEAYWIGGAALGSVPAPIFGRWLAERFGGQPGVDWALVRSLVEAGAAPHHSFHVLAIYPWLGLLRAGREGRPLEVLDRCRVRWGTVLAVEGDVATVASRPLSWDGHALGLGEPVEERLEAAFEGHAAVPGLAQGDAVAAHWSWVCDRLDGDRVERLRSATLRHLELVNAIPA